MMSFKHPPEVDVEAGVRRIDRRARDVHPVNDHHAKESMTAPRTHVERMKNSRMTSGDMSRFADPAGTTSGASPRLTKKEKISARR